ncbi:protein-tyrosine phosphatase domain-containing protein [Ditylenchus destructor]|nr:protein-tyrosine phosphatase domain-containing protein [Ditylenchus destructor]
MPNIKKENYSRGHKKKSPTRHEKKAKSRLRTEEDGQNDDRRKQEEATERVFKGNYVPPKKQDPRKVRLDDSQSARKPKVVARNKEVQAKEKPKTRDRDKDKQREHKVKDKKLTGFAKLFSFSEDASDGEGNQISVNKRRKPAHKKGGKDEFRRSRSKGSSGNEEDSKNEKKERSEGESGREHDVRNSEHSGVIAKKSKPEINKASLVTSVPSRAVDIIFKRFAILTMGKGIRGLLQEFAALQAECPKPTPSQRVSFDRNREKNRYKDIYCWESSRVVLSWSPGGRQSSYIHANWIKGIPNMPRKTICTQGPMADTIADFWRMIWQEKCQGILMLCAVTENGKKKCEQYWPKSEGSETALGTTHEKATYIYLTIKNIGVKVKNEFAITKLALCGMHSNGTVREHIVTHIQWAEWPDKSVPISAVSPIRALGKTRGMSPLVVHCSAGVGRTGTIVIIDAVLGMLVNGRDAKIYDIVKEIRSQRYNACQTDLQYLYIHRVILAYLVHTQIMSKVQVSRFIDDYTDLIEERNQAKTAGQ